MEVQPVPIARPLKLLFISTYPPKACGIGTFTEDLLEAIAAGDQQTDYRVVAINDPIDDLTYPWVVRQQIDKEELESLDRVARYCTESGADAIGIQHEFGIWGGFDGEFVLHFLDRVKIPVVVTLHSVPLTRSSFNRDNRVRIVREMAKRVAHIVTFVPDARDFLIDECGVPKDHVTVIWHGAPTFPMCREVETKQRLGLGDNLVISTFGLLTRFKGLEYAIHALPPLVEKYPNLVYLILGQAHPAEPTTFLPGLESLVAQLNLKEHVRFVTHFLSDEEIQDYFSATDIYLTPYLDETQISSGTLTYALSAGKATVATRYIYARNALADQRGVIVPFADSAAISSALDQLLGDAELRAEYAARARSFGERLAWPVVAAEYLDVVRRVVENAEDANATEDRRQRTGSRL